MTYKITIETTDASILSSFSPAPITHPKKQKIDLTSWVCGGAIAISLTIQLHPEASKWWDSQPLVQQWQQQVENWLQPAPTNADYGAIADEALRRVGTNFNPGIKAQCAVFVRDVLTSVGVDLPVTQKALDSQVIGRASFKAMANSMAGSDIGQVIKNVNDLQPGDLVFFANTYGNWPKGTITHIGIAIGNGMMVDRPTADSPVKKRPISTFRFVSGIRVHPKYFKAKLSRNVKAFLDTIAWAEGTNDKYNLIFTGVTFSGFGAHPDIVKCTGKGEDQLCSSAAGRYQVLTPTWNRLQNKLGLSDFSPASQDKAAIELIKESNALDDVEAGRFEVATAKVRKIWASLPSAGYGQPEKKMDELKRVYLNKGGRINE